MSSNRVQRDKPFREFNALATPTANAGPDVVANEGAQVSLSGSLSTPATADAHTVSVNWGDGSAVETIGLGAGVNTFVPSHAYVDAGSYVVTVTVTDPDGDSDSDTAAYTITSVNDAPALSIAATDAEKLEGDSGVTTFTFAVTRAGDTSGTTDVNYAVTGFDGAFIQVIGGPGPADPDDFVDGVFPSGTVTFLPGQTARPIDVTVSGDTDFEGDDFFDVTLSSASGGAQIITSSATGIIQNDDARPVINTPPVLTTSDVTLSVGGSVAAVSAFTYFDAENDPAVTYEFWDSGPAASSGYFAIGGVRQPEGMAIEVDAADLGQVTLVGGAVRGIEDLYVRANDGTDRGDWHLFTLTTLTEDGEPPGVDFEPGPGTAGRIGVGGAMTGEVAFSGDFDGFEIDLVAGTRYVFDLLGSATGDGTLSDPLLRLLDPNGTLIAQDDDGGTGLNAQLVYSTAVSGTYFLSARAFGADTGIYRLTAAEANTPPVLTTSDVTLSVGGSERRLTELHDVAASRSVCAAKGQIYGITCGLPA